jgi:hypothetical protein
MGNEYFRQADLMSDTKSHPEPLSAQIARDFIDYRADCMKALLLIGDRDHETEALWGWLSRIEGDVPSMRDIMHDEPLKTVASFLNIDAQSRDLVRLNQEFHRLYKPETTGVTR